MNSVQLATQAPSTIEVECLQLLPYDLKRMLRMQWKEFINFIEDAQLHVAIDPAP